MEITIDLIIGTSMVLAILCWILAGYYYHQVKKRIGSSWLVGGLLMAGLAGFFIWTAIPLWTSL
ncbi:hypothetical protein [Lactiplantibacillus xiangfangensis]|jgi:hypothetical protein|uniref:Uncharacterized protein n=1 Tax=Lactiplantibacillus xiangfangensis TaxID=942150 RepID=A0A0R2MUK3_9LACO|nr:hypothetical protein [Lactiplantibacillus xiangfangensis]KRO14362.1 hypothetical protein IV64_GL001656 [Lactiplantibacillus xiangfangensis]